MIFTSSAMASSRSGTSSTLAVLKLTRRCSKNRRHDFLEAGPDFRRRAFLYHDCAGHSRADQHPGWHVRNVDADRNALRQSYPGECGIDGGEELRAILVVLVRDGCRARTVRTFASSSSSESPTTPSRHATETLRPPETANTPPRTAQKHAAPSRVRQRTTEGTSAVSRSA
jgi:hypothetical protein